MTSQTIAHPQGHVLVNHIHRLHLAVAGLAQNPGIHVRPMVKIDMVRQRVNSLPPERLSQRVNRGQCFDGRAIGLCHPVAVHAFFDGWNAGLTRSLGAGMAIEARDPESARVELMRVRDGLLRLISADEPIGLGIPADSRHRGQDRRNPDGQDEF
jgi:hypothetical protein